MKSSNEMRKPAKSDYSTSDEFTKKRKLKPLKKEKNPKRAYFEEIDDLEDIDFESIVEDFDDEDFYDDDDDY
ncbi:MAG TPA: hypothetical protein DG754_11160 [Bacteroidales bacterium]|jgi:hypothetical protein|nr:hypothetical protein [Bacteroidales bacterium]